MLKDLLYLVSFYSTDSDRLILKLYCNIYFKFINDFKLCCINNEIISINILSLINNNLNWDWGLYYACRGGRHDLANLMISKGANNWYFGLYHSCFGGNINIVKLMINKLETGSLYPLNDTTWNWGLWGACDGDHRDVINLMINKGATYCNHCFCRVAVNHFYFKN